MSKINATEIVTWQNPATGQIGTSTAKVYHSIYADKGFMLVTRDNVEVGVAAGRTSGEKRRSEPASETGSAASIAQGLGLDNSPANDAEKGVAKGTNAKQIDADRSDASAERESNKRDRGRG